MPERCPLSGGGRAIESLPGFCLEHCGRNWDDALRTQAPMLDDYEAPTEECSHGPIVYSHEALQAADGSELRVYSVVDECEECKEELRENSYTFNCPYN